MPRQGIGWKELARAGVIADPITARKPPSKRIMLEMYIGRRATQLNQYRNSMSFKDWNAFERWVHDPAWMGYTDG